MPPYSYNMPEQDRWGADQNAHTEAEKAIDKLDANGVLRLWERANSTQEKVVATDKFQKDVQVFLHENPAYVDSDHNRKLMETHWQEALGVEIPTYEQIEDSYHTLRSHGVITLNKSAVAKENERQVLERAAELREKRKAEAFDEASAYTMSMEELEAKIRGW